MQHPEENPWRINSEKDIYDNPWINLTEYQVINPAGKPGIYGKVHFKNMAIGVVALDDEMNTYLVGQYRFTLGQYCWEIPEGGCPLGTDPLQRPNVNCWKRPGWKASHWRELQQIHLSNSVCDEFGFIYLAQGLWQFEPEPEDTEQLITKKVPFAVDYLMVCDNEITDSISIAAILKIRLM